MSARACSAAACLPGGLLARLHGTAACLALQQIKCVLEAAMSTTTLEPPGTTCVWWSAASLPRSWRASWGRVPTPQPR